MKRGWRGNELLKIHAFSLLNGIGCTYTGNDVGVFTQTARHPTELFTRKESDFRAITRFARRPSTASRYTEDHLGAVPFGA